MRKISMPNLCESSKNTHRLDLEFVTQFARSQRIFNLRLTHMKVTFVKKVLADSMLYHKCSDVEANLLSRGSIRSL